MIPATGLAKITETLRSPNYGSYVIGNGTSLVGTWMQRIGVGWLAWELTGSPFWLGLIAFAELFPAVFVGPVAGAVADRRNRLRLVQFTQFLASVQAVTLFALAVTDNITILTLGLLSLFLGIVSAFNQPARLALITSLVEQRQLNSAIGINSVIFNLARFIGPAIAGIIIANGHISWVFGLNALATAFFVFVLLRLRLTVPAKPARARKHFISDITDGIGYAIRDPHISTLLAMLITIGLGVRPLVELLPGLAAAVFTGGPQTLALLTSSLGGGAIIGGLWLAGRDHGNNLSNTVMLGILGQATALLLFISTPSLWVAVPAIALLGLAMSITGAGIQTSLQLHVDGDMRGRVLSLYGLILRGGPAIGTLTMGWMAEYLGLRLPLAGGAVIVALVALRFIVLTRIKKQ